ncbi:2-oxo acid dehydrogenase subunit E2 [Lachnospiraceae bacterium MD308]|nr:2-oxo acid dehydrogenase subunit E2 [Lachnospiraceae bacterium MD308]
MIKEIRMPAGGQTTDVSVVGTWLVKIGDKVERGDALLEIETDKATLTVESYAKGIVLALLVEEGDETPAGEVIALIGDESDREEAKVRLAGEDVLKNQKPEEEKKAIMEETLTSEEEYQPIDKNAPRRTKPKAFVSGSEKDVLKQNARKPGQIKAMPNAKVLAKENHILLEDVAEASGKNVLKRQDVAAFLENHIQEKEETIIPFTNMRRVIARRMLDSVQNIPVFTAAVEIDMTQCMAFRRLVNSAKDERKVSYNDILFKCMEAAIRAYPYVNTSYSDEGILLHKDVNIGLAVSVEGGLVVPVVRRVQEKSISEIAAYNRENIGKARDGSLSLEEMSGGTITLSNLGMYPITQFTAIINPPEVCILAVGAIEEKPVFADGTWRAVPVMKLTGSFDHRIVDGAYAAGFLGELKRIIENPALALV